MEIQAISILSPWRSQSDKRTSWKSHTHKYLVLVSHHIQQWTSVLIPLEAIVISSVPTGVPFTLRTARTFPFFRSASFLGRHTRARSTSVTTETATRHAKCRLPVVRTRSTACERWHREICFEDGKKNKRKSRNGRRGGRGRRVIEGYARLETCFPLESWGYERTRKWYSRRVVSFYSLTVLDSLGNRTESFYKRSSVANSRHRVTARGTLTWAETWQPREFAFARCADASAH